MRDLNTTIAQFLEQKITLFLEAYRAAGYWNDEILVRDLEELLVLLNDYLNWWENLYYKYKWKELKKEEKRAERRMLTLFKKVFPKLWY
jgi:hypothetical protein